MESYSLKRNRIKIIQLQIKQETLKLQGRAPMVKARWSQGFSTEGIILSQHLKSNSTKVHLLDLYRMYKMAVKPDQNLTWETPNKPQRDNTIKKSVEKVAQEVTMEINLLRINFQA